MNVYSTLISLMENQLIAPILQFIASILALAAIIWTQISLNKRAERDISSRFEQQKSQQQHEKKIKAQYLKLEKIEKIYELVQGARQKYVDLDKRLELQRGENLNDELCEDIEKTLIDCSIYRTQVELLSKLYLSNEDNLCVFWRNTSKSIYPHFKRRSSMEQPSISEIREGIRSTTQRMNQIFEKLATYANINSEISWADEESPTSNIGKTI